MPVLRNPRHERFCQYLAQGETVTDAHEKAGYRRNDGNASTLAHHPEVQARLKEIKGELAAKTVVTAETLLAEFEEVRAAAMGQETRQFNAANSAIKGKAVLTGNWVERAEIGTPGEFDAMEDSELIAAIRERFYKLEHELESETRLAINDGSVTLNGASRTLKDRDN